MAVWRSATYSPGIVTLLDYVPVGFRFENQSFLRLLCHYFGTYKFNDIYFIAIVYRGCLSTHSLLAVKFMMTGGT